MFKKFTSGLLALLLILTMFPVQALATETAEVPAVTEAIVETVPAETAAETEATVPVTEETVPATEETVPVTEETVPATEETVPATEETVPATEETVPATEETVPATEETVPATEETVPATEETVPATEETVPETEAEETEPEIFHLESKAMFNPLYDHMYPDRELPEIDHEEPGIVADHREVSYITSYSSLKAAVRSKLVARQSSITVYYQCTSFSDYILSELYYDAMEHTGKPKEGDYLMWQWDYVYWDGYYTTDGYYYYLTIEYDVDYMTSASQEKTMDNQVAALLKQLDLDGYTQYEKIRIIYDWMTENIRYDYANLGNSNYTLKHSAYAALVNKTAVCQGYSNLFYRLLLTIGIDCRQVPSIEEECHIWNIVKLNGKYYNCDATWDEGQKTYSYFLRCPSTFDKDHTRDYDYRTSSFHSKYPMATSNYDIRNVVTRVSGSNRCVTSTNAATRLKGILGVQKFSKIIVADGTNYPDALSGSYLAAVAKAPVLLMQSGKESVILNYIKQNLYSNGTVYILGGTNSISSSFENSVRNCGVTGVKTSRISGSNRYDTSLKIIRTADSVKGSKATKILVCTGLNYADSLSASATGLPILLVKGTDSALNSAQKSYLSSLNKKADIYVIGGTSAVSAKILTALNSYDRNGSAERISGNSREATSVAVANKFFPTSHTATLAYSQNFPDGLSGGPVAYALGAPLLLVNSGKETAANGYIDQKNVIKGFIFGGTNSVSDSSAKKVFGSNILLK